MKNWYKFERKSMKQENIHYLLEEGPWWIFLLIEINHLICHSIYCCFGWVKLPSFLYIYDGGNKYSWREWYGDISQIYHLYVCDPIFQWCEKKKKTFYL